MQRLPLLSLALCGLAGLFMLLPPGLAELLYFDRERLAGGDPVGLVTGHWLHADPGHLAWNAAGLSILAAMIERRSRRLLLWSVAAGTLSVDLLLLSPLCDLPRYCGLSGLLNTLLGVALYLHWRDTRTPVAGLVALAALLKIALEIRSGHSLFTEIGWPPYAPAHLAGMAGAAVSIACLRAVPPGPIAWR